LKNKTIIIITIIYFSIINTTYYWEGKLGILAFPAFFFLFTTFLIFLVILGIQCYFLIQEKLANKQRLFLVIFLTVILSLIYYKPFGLIEFNKFEAKTVLEAQREGAANCKTTFKLKNDFTFKEKNVCFGITEVTGSYKVINDTIYFENIEKGKEEDAKYTFGIIEELKTYTENRFALKLYKNKLDTIGLRYFIEKNELQINPKKVESSYNN